MEKFDECIIHIGTPKTGSTTLQEFFYKNKKNLDKKDIFFPKTFGEKNHVNLYKYSLDIEKTSHGRIRSGLRNKESIENFRIDIRKSFQDEIKNQNCSKILLSAEELSKLESLNEIKFLKKFLDEFVKEYKIIIYLRPQHEYEISRYTTKAIFGVTREKVFPPYEKPISLLTYDVTLDRWEEVFGHDNIFPRIFSHSEFLDGDIKKDFIHFLELKWNDFTDVENENTSLNQEAQRFLIKINRFLPLYVDGKLNEERGDIAKHVAKNRLGKGVLPTYEETINFFKIYDDTNERVRKKWFPQRKNLFEVDFSKYPIELILENDYTYAFKIFAEIWAEKQRELNLEKNKNSDKKRKYLFLFQKLKKFWVK